MKKVTIEITPQGWTTIIELDGKTIIDKYKATNYGATGITASLEDNESLSDELYEAIESIGAYDVMRAL